MKTKLQMIALGSALLLGLSGCGGKAPVIAEQASILATAASSSEKFSGVVVSEGATEIVRDMEKTVEELYVKEGDEVRVNQKLFSYDTDTLSLDIDKQELELDKLTNEIKELTTQISTLEKKIKSEKDKNVKATLELSLRSEKANKTQKEFDKKALQADITYNKNMLKNADVRSPIQGTIRKIDENGSPYITIQRSGAYQIQGTLNELSMNAGIQEGTAVTVLSRVNPEEFWTGTVTSVDYNSASGNEYDNNFGMGSDSMSSSSNYPFYITLNHTRNLLLGQHVYIQISAAGIQDDLLRIPERYIMDVYVDDTAFETVGTVWAVDSESGKLTKQDVVLGEYDDTYDTYVIESGITAESYLADPADPGCAEGAAVVLHSALEYSGQVPETTQPATTTPESIPEATDDPPASDPSAPSVTPIP